MEIELDGVSFSLRFRGFRKTLQAKGPSGKKVRLRPWTCEEHLRALAAHLRPSRDGVELEGPGFAREILARSDAIADDAITEFEPLALWWAAGGEARPAQGMTEGWARLGAARVRLRPWTCGERLDAMRDSLRSAADGTTMFNPAVYLDCMVDASMEAVEPDGRHLRDLDSSATADLLEAVVSVNVTEDDLAHEVAAARDGSQQMAVDTLRVCRALGCTPSEAWALPAPEVDRLLAVLDRAEGVESKIPQVRSGLAAYPDAVVIEIEDDSP